MGTRRDATLIQFRGKGGLTFVTALARLGRSELRNRDHSQEKDAEAGLARARVHPELTVAWGQVWSRGRNGQEDKSKGEPLHELEYREISVMPVRRTGSEEKPLGNNADQTSILARGGGGRASPSWGWG